MVLLFYLTPATNKFNAGAWAIKTNVIPTLPDRENPQPLYCKTLVEILSICTGKNLP